MKKLLYDFNVVTFWKRYERNELLIQATISMNLDSFMPSGNTKGYYCIILIIKGKQGTFGNEGNTLHLDCGGSYTILCLSNSTITYFKR